MIVIVCTLDKLHQSISDLDKDNRQYADSRRWVAPVLTDFFLNSNEGRSLLAYENCQFYSFTLDMFSIKFVDWISSEVVKNPGNAERIAEVRDLVIRLLGSEWPIKSNLVVFECLGEIDANLPPNPV